MGKKQPKPHRPVMIQKFKLYPILNTVLTPFLVNLFLKNSCFM